MRLDGICPTIQPHILTNRLRCVWCLTVLLNDALLQGPNLISSLIGVLIRFRKEGLVLVDDIESMFHQIQVDFKDTSALRFLWWS